VKAERRTPTHRFTKTFSIPEDAIDELGHVSNLKYIAWMQEIAIEHSAAQVGRSNDIFRAELFGLCVLTSSPTSAQLSPAKRLRYRRG
jgi:acyl-CoA thioesterase FadM